MRPSAWQKKAPDVNAAGLPLPAARLSVGDHPRPHPGAGPDQPCSGAFSRSRSRCSPGRPGSLPCAQTRASGACRSPRTCPSLHQLPAALFRRPARHLEPETAELPEISRVLTDLTRSAAWACWAVLVCRWWPARRWWGSSSSSAAARIASRPTTAPCCAVLPTRPPSPCRMPNCIPRSARKRQRMDALLNSAADGILILSASRTIERCNPALLRLLKNRPFIQKAR